MRKSTFVTWTVLLAFALWGSIAYADVVTADIQFPFKAGGKEFSAGKYRLESDLQSGDIILRNESTGKALLLPVTERLSGRDEALVVFDKQGDQYYLSEIYMPGIDGFEVKAATGKHTHVKVKAGK